VKRIRRGHAFLDRLDVTDFEVDRAAGALPTRLQAGLPREDDHQVLPDLQKGLGQGVLESLP